MMDSCISRLSQGAAADMSKSACIVYVKHSHLTHQYRMHHCINSPDYIRIFTGSQLTLGIRRLVSILSQHVL